MVRRAAWRWAIFGLGLAILSTAATLRLLGPLNAGLLRVRQDFRPSPSVSLFDSLPALSPGLAGLEAFSLSLPPGTPATADRALWLADVVDSVRFAFHSDREPFDSVTLYLWAGDSVRQRTHRRRGSQDWNVPIKREVKGWSEIAGFYLSYPPLFKIRASDASITPFERVEGTVFQVVANDYGALSEPLVPPDTAYPALRFGEMTLLARGRTLAVVNPSRKAMRLRLLHVEIASSTLHVVPPGTVRVYRNLLDRAGTTLAYTGAGEPLCVLGRCRTVNREFFRLGARSAMASAETASIKTAAAENPAAR